MPGQRAKLRAFINPLREYLMEKVPFLFTPGGSRASNRLERTRMRAHKPSVKLEDWAVVESANTASYQSLGPGNLLVGRAFGHQRIKTGMFIFTSPIVDIDAQNKIVETRNTCYCLGEPSREYKEWIRGQQTGAAA
jgi:hypothetical protein